jgi:2-C-methyl-D-erythritol 2,4-cyclodiphosphate synthase
MLIRSLLLLATLTAPSVTSFVLAGPKPSIQQLAASSVETEDLLKPSYDIEPITLRIGHGFDIHRMAPVEVAGQPIVIGGVEIPHKDQKVEEFEFVA